MKNTKKRGFTIVELVIVIAVIAILAAVLIPTFKNVIDSANKSKAMQTARNAYTNWLAEDASKIATRQGESFWIKCGDYYFEVKTGQFMAESGTRNAPVSGNLFEIAANTSVFPEASSVLGG